MTLKTKLSLGLGFLFLIIFILVGLCSYYIGRLGLDADNILKDNYKSIVYANNMLSGFDEMKTSVSSITHNANHTGRMSDYYIKLFESGRNLFESNLKEENNNITEIREKEYVETLNQDYAAYLKLCLEMENGRGGSPMFNDFLTASEKLKQSIITINDVNMQAVVRKNNITKLDSERFKNSMVLIGVICFMLALGYFWYFPVYISTSISYLADKMKNLLTHSGISFDIKTNDEAYVILQAINLLENKLGVKKENSRND